MILVHALLAVVMTFQRLDHPPGYYDTMPVYFRVIISPAWIYGIPLAGAAALVHLLTRGPAGRGGYLGTAVVLAVTAIATWYVALYT